MFLERWLYDQMREGLNLADLQLSRLRGTLDYVYKESAFYRDSFDRARVKPDDVHSLEDLAYFPFTTAEDLRDEPYRLLCISLSQVKRIFTLYSGGTSGTPKIVFFSQKDLERITDYMGAAVKSVAESGGVSTQEFKVYILLPDEKPESQQKTVAKGVEKVGGCLILGDLALNTEEQLERIEESQPDILLGPVSRIYRITQHAECNLSRLGVKIVFITSEYVPASMRERLQDMWKAEVFTHYGMTEMGWAGGIECEAHNGLHFNEADLLLEVVDSATGVVLKNGEEGELVLTTLNREAMPLIRYRTGDLGRLMERDCECGASRLKRIGALIRRKDSLVKLASGAEIYPAMFDDALYGIPDIIDYQSSLIREGDKERLVFNVELTGKWATAEEEITKAVLNIPLIRNNVEVNLMTEPKIELMDQGMLKRKGRAKKLILDERLKGQTLTP